MSYDKKFKERVLTLVDAGYKQEYIRKMFNLGANTITQWKNLRKETGSLEKKPVERRWRKIDPEKLKTDIEVFPDDFHKERAERFECSESGIKKALRKNKIKRKKNKNDKNLG